MNKLALICALVALASPILRGQTLFSDTFDNTTTFNSNWTVNTSAISSAGANPPSYTLDTSGAGKVTLVSRPTLLSTVTMPSSYSGTISFRFANATDILSLGLLGSSQRATNAPNNLGHYGQYYGLSLAFNAANDVIQINDLPQSGNANSNGLISQQAYNFSSGVTYNFGWTLNGSSLTVTDLDHSTVYNFSNAVTVSGGTSFWLNNREGPSGTPGLEVYSISASAVPEPSTCALLGGLAALSVAAYRRHRAKCPVAAA